MTENAGTNRFPASTRAALELAARHGYKVTAVLIGGTALPSCRVVEMNEAGKSATLVWDAAEDRSVMTTVRVSDISAVQWDVKPSRKAPR